MSARSTSALERLRGSLLRQHLRLQRRDEFHNHGNLIRVWQGVLNPTLFRASLRFVDRCLLEAPASRSRVLELGCGTGIAACALARHGHRVTAVDRSIAAAGCCASNAQRNQLSLTTVHGNWSQSLRNGGFDYVVCNPPFLSQRPRSIEGPLELALWAGEQDRRLHEAVVAAERCMSLDGQALVMTSQQADRGLLRALYLELGLFCSTSTERLYGDHLIFDLLRRQTP